MKKIISIGLTGLTMATLASSTAFAWTYGLSGKGTCQSNGSYQITWSVDNTTENEALHIKSSSNTSVVPLGDVPAHQVKNYKQTVDGTKAGSYSLSLTGNFNSDQTLRTRSATVNLDKPCTQPDGGKGGGTTVTPATPAATPAAVAPAVIPVGAVNAGNGGVGSSLNLAAISAAVISLAAIVVGIVRRVKA